MTTLPARPSLENLKKQAKTLLKTHQSGDSSVCAMLRLLHRFSDLSDEQILGAKLSLAEAQYAIAMDYGFSSWSALKDAVQGRENERKFLHLHCGDISGESLRKSGVPGRVEIWYDAFTEGPVPDRPYDDTWFALRANTFLDRFESLESGVSFFKDMYARLDTFRDYDEVVLWFDACLFDQTIMIRHLDWFSRQQMGNTKLSLICIGEFPGMSRFKGLGELRPEQLAPLLQTRHEVSQQELELARKAWSAYRAPDPTAIGDLLSQDTTMLPYLAPALKRHLQRFPSVRNGLGRLEQACLELIEQGHTGFVDIYWRASELENPPYFGDTIVLNHLLPLAQAPQPLLNVEGLEFTNGLPKHEWPLKTLSFTITDIGREALAGTADMVRMNGIDVWLGGVHLQGREAQWRWDEGIGRLVKA